MSKKKAKNLLANDPTRTLTLRNRAVGEINRRYGQIKKLITTSLVKNKIFLENADALKPSDFVFLRTPEKLERFDIWLEQIVAEIILSGSTSVNNPELNWLLKYIEESYVRGSKRGNNSLAREFGRNQVPVQINPLTVPFHVERLQFLFTRDFAQLKGITETMSQQINYELSQGLLQGQGIKKIARNMTNRVDAIGIARSRLLARTEIVNTLNLATLNEAELLEAQLGEEIVAIWVTSLDGRERPTHRSRDNRYYSIEKVSTLIGEPNCRCAVELVPINRVPEGVSVIR